MILLDTDHLSVLANQRESQHARLVARVESSITPPLATTVVTVEEQCRGWLAQINRVTDVRRQVWPYTNLAKLFAFLAAWQIVLLNDDAVDYFERLRKQRVRVGSQDLKIASIALAHDALLLTANLRDFRQVPGLRMENWLD